MIDLLAAPGDPLLEQAVRLPDAGEVPIVSAEVLVLMKLRAGRAQDVADVSNLVLAGLDVGFVGSWLVEHAPEHFATFSEIAQDALRS